MIREFERVILQVDLPEHRLLAGDIGIVQSLLDSQVRLVKQKETAHVREIAA